MEEKKNKNIMWYDNPNRITNLLLILIVGILIISESFAIHNNLSTMDIFKNIMNHNSVYFLVLGYFILLKIDFGKKYFNFLNLFLILLYFITTITSALTIFQSFSLDALLSFCVHVLLVIYLVHTFFRGTRVWKEFKLAKSPFHELSNEWYFYALFILAVIALAVNLISTTSFAGTILCFLDFVYLVLFSRYIYLYQDFLNKKGMDVPPSSTKYLDKVIDATEEIKEKVEEFKEEHAIDEKIDALASQVTQKVKKEKKEIKEEKKVKGTVKKGTKKKGGDTK